MIMQNKNEKKRMNGILCVCVTFKSFLTRSDIFPPRLLVNTLIVNVFETVFERALKCTVLYLNCIVQSVHA